MPRLSITIPLSITGRSAIAAVRHDLSGDAALSLSKFADPTAAAEDDISLEAAEEICASDPSLVRLDAELEIWLDLVCGTWAKVGHLSICVDPASVTDAGPVVVSADPPPGCHVLRASEAPDVTLLVRRAAEKALAVYLRAQLDALGEP